MRDKSADTSGVLSGRIVPQAAVFPIHPGEEYISVLLITSIKRKRWILPKGVVEKNHKPEQTALLEAYEEAGIRGNLIGSVEDVYTYRKWGGVCRVEVFLMEVIKLEDEWPEKALRQRKWIPLEDLEGLIDARIPRNLIRRLKLRAERWSSERILSEKTGNPLPEA